MRVCVFFISLMLFFNSYAGTGDEWLISASNVNLRTGPSTDFKVRKQLKKGSSAVELQRKGEWLEIGVRNSGGVMGWIHDSLLKPRQP